MADYVLKRRNNALRKFKSTKSPIMSFVYLIAITCVKGDLPSFFKQACVPVWEECRSSLLRSSCRWVNFPLRLLFHSMTYLSSHSSIVDMTWRLVPAVAPVPSELGWCWAEREELTLRLCTPCKASTGQTSTRCLGPSTTQHSAELVFLL